MTELAGLDIAIAGCSAVVLIYIHCTQFLVYLYIHSFVFVVVSLISIYLRFMHILLSHCKRYATAFKCSPKVIDLKAFCFTFHTFYLKIRCNHCNFKYLIGISSGKINVRRCEEKVAFLLAA